MMTSIKPMLIIVFIFSLIYNIAAEQNVCQQANSCLCEIGEYSKIDLNGIIPSPSNDSVFLQDEEKDITYMFHGCTDGLFNLTANGINSTETWKTTLLAIYPNKTAVNIANSSQIHFNKIEEADGAYEIVFKAGDNVTANIQLICNLVSPSLFKVVDASKNHYALISPKACMITHHPGLSTGSVLIILLIVSLFIYFICGGLILYFIRGARGVELIPNIDFWRQLPGLVKDGIIFLFSGCNPHIITTPETYDRI